MVFHIAAQTKTITMSKLEMYSFPMAILTNNHKLTGFKDHTFIIL